MRSAIYNSKPAPFSSKPSPRKQKVLLEETEMQRRKRGAGGGREWRGQRNCEFHSYLNFSSLSSSSQSVTWIVTSDSNQKTLSSPEVLLSLSVSILYLKKKQQLDLQAWNKKHQYSGCSALLMYTQMCGWYPSDRYWWWFNYSQGTDRKSQAAQSLRLTAILGDT